MKYRAGRGTLAVIAVFFAASAAIRLGDGLGMLARAAEGQVATPDTTGETCPPPPLALANALSEREARLAARETLISQRADVVALSERALAGKLEALEAAEAELRSLLALSDGAAEADLTRLTAVYEAMKSRDAAALFEQMAPEFAAGFLGRMRPQAAGAILSGMSKEKAYAVSAVVAGRNARAPTE